MIDFPHLLCLFFMTPCKKQAILIIKTSGFAGFDIKIYEILIMTGKTRYNTPPERNKENSSSSDPLFLSAFTAQLAKKLEKDKIHLSVYCLNPTIYRNPSIKK